jgi:hypothetical protein
MAQKKIYILAHKKTYLGNRTNAKSCWERIEEVLGADTTIYYEDGKVQNEENTVEYSSTNGKYANFTKVIKENPRLFVENNETLERVTVWLGYVNEG